MTTALWKFALALLGIGLFLAVAIALDQWFGIAVDLSYRVACAGICLAFIAKLDFDSGGERWLRIALALSALVNIGLFFTPIFDRPPSRGEVMLFALPDAVILLAVRIATYPVGDVHQRAVRQQLIAGLILAVIVCALLIASTFIPDK